MKRLIVLWVLTAGALLAYGAAYDEAESNRIRLDTRNFGGSASATSNGIRLDTREADAVVVTEATQASDGSGRVQVTFRLKSATATAMQARVSNNGGSTYGIVPSAAALSGDIGVSLSAGTHTFEWDAAEDLADGTFGTNFRAKVCYTVNGTEVAGVSSAFTLDLRGLGGGLEVSGRVKHGETGTALQGVAIALGGDSAVTSSNGRFSLSDVSLSVGSTLTASKDGFTTYSAGVSAPAGGARLELGDIRLSPAAGPDPVVTSLKASYTGLFLEHASVPNTFRATVNWQGETPGTVRFYANDSLAGEYTGAGPAYECEIDMGSAFPASRRARDNKVSVVATNAGGGESEARIEYVSVIPLPDAVEYLLPGRGDTFPLNFSVNAKQVYLDCHLPQPPIKAVLDLPVIGKFGAEFGVNGSFDYTFADGDWELALGAGAEARQGKRGRRPDVPGLTRHPRLKLYVGNKEISGGVGARADGTASLAGGIVMSEVGAYAEIAAKLELGRVGVLDLFGPGLSTSLGKIPGLGKALKTVSAIIYVLPAVEGDVAFALDPEFTFKEAELTGKVGLEAAYEPDLGLASMRLYIGGEPSVTFQIPGDLFKELRFRAYAGAEFKAWLITLGPFEHVFVDVSIPSRGTQGHVVGTAGDRAIVLLPVARSGDGMATVDRSYLADGPERFVLGTRGQSEARDTFRALGAGPVRGSVLAGSVRASRTAREDEPETAQADLRVIENVFPDAEPALGGYEQELMLLYVADNGSESDLQFTDIRWSRYDGTDWSTPAAIATDTRAEFAPQVAFDGNGDAVAVWERVRDPDFGTVDIEAMAAEMEIVWSRWDRETGLWTTPEALSDNTFLDHQPQLAGPMGDGSLLLVWTRNEQNLLTGSGEAGAAENDTVIWSRWDPAMGEWAAPAVLVPDLPYRVSQSLAGSGQTGVYVWSRDVDGDLSTTADRDLFYKMWDGDAGAWGEITAYATDGLGDTNVRAAVADAGEVVLLWERAGDLVMDRNLARLPRTVIAQADTVGWSDFVLTFGAADNLVLLWQEMSEDGSDAHYAVFDPASDTWSRTERLFRTPELERSFAPVWDAAGNLTVAYNRVEITKVTKTVELEDGTTLDIANVPESGRVDLGVVRRQLVRDVTLADAGFTIQGNDYLPGDALTLTAHVRNSGNVALENVTVAFYDGDPDAGGARIAEAAHAGWLAGAGEVALSATWVVPEPAGPHTIWAVLDPADAIAEFAEDDNRQGMSIGGTDLEVSLVSWGTEDEGTVQVVARVRNGGAPASAAEVLAVRYDGEGSPLATGDVPALEPGMLAQLVLDLPAGTQPAGEKVYELYLMRTERAGADTNPDNDAVVFSVYRWVDDDADDLPDDWEETHFSSTDPGPDDDFDGDGETNGEEYANGTDPADARSAHDPANAYTNFSFQLTRVGDQQSDGSVTADGWRAALVCQPPDGYTIVSGTVTKPGTTTGTNPLPFTWPPGLPPTGVETEHTTFAELAADFVPGPHTVHLVLDSGRRETTDLRFAIDVAAYQEADFPEHVLVESPLPGAVDVSRTPLIDLGSADWDSLRIEGQGVAYSAENAGDTDQHQMAIDDALPAALALLLEVSRSDADGTWLGSVTCVTFTTVAPPAITQHPEPATRQPGQAVAFAVSANGTPLLTYQWQKDGADIADATQSTYTIDAVAEEDEGGYRCLVRNEVGEETSDTAVLTVDSPPVVATPISDVTVGWGVRAATVDLAGVFTDPDNDDAGIATALHSNSNPGLVGAVLDGDGITLAFAAGQTGTADITVRATSNGLTVDTSFSTTVTSAESWWEFPLLLQGADKSELIFGMRDGATDLFDPAYDRGSDEAPGPASESGGGYSVDAGGTLYARDPELTAGSTGAGQVGHHAWGVATASRRHCPRAVDVPEQPGRRSGC